MNGRTIYLARLIGIVMLVTSVSMLIAPDTIAAAVVGTVDSQPLLFLFAFPALTCGVALLLAHSEWTGGYVPVLVTLVGWSLTLKGGLLMVLSAAQERALLDGLGYTGHIRIWAIAPLLIGIALSWGGFRER